MLTEHLHRHIPFVSRVGTALYIFACAFCYSLQIAVAAVINKGAVGLERIYKLAERIYIQIEGREHIDMIPCYAGQNGGVRVIPQEL